MEKVTIFYESSEGKMTQWSGQLVTVKANQLTLLRHKQEMNFVFDNTQFLLVTKNHVKDIGLSERPCELFSNELRDNLVDTFKDNVQLLWLNSKLVVQKAKVPTLIQLSQSFVRLNFNSRKTSIKLCCWIDTM